MPTAFAVNQQVPSFRFEFLAGVALFHAVDDGAAARLEALLDPAQAVVDPAPAGADQVDEEGEVVDPAVPLGEQVALEPLEPPDRLRHQAAHLGEVPSDREHLLAEALLDDRKSVV